jgi:hypothetical protein
VKLILGLIWCLIAHYQLGASNFPPKKLMLAWLKVRSYCTVHRLFMLAWLIIQDYTGHMLLYSIQAHAGLAQGGVKQYTDCCTVYKLVLVWLKVGLYSTQNAEHRTSSRWPGSRCGHTVHRLYSISDSVQSQVDVLYVHRLRSNTQAEEHNSGFCTLHRLLWHT